MLKDIIINFEKNILVFFVLSIDLIDVNYKLDVLYK